MSQGNPHLYPPDGQDPHLAAYFDQLLQERLQEIKAMYTKELESREAAFQQRDKEHIEYREALQAHINELSTRLASATVVSPEIRLPDGDALMQAMQPIDPPTGSPPINRQSAPKAQKASRRSRLPPPPVPDSAPSRNLRSMKRIDTNSTFTDPNPPTLPAKRGRAKAKLPVAALSSQPENPTPIPAAPPPKQPTATPPNNIDSKKRSRSALKPHRLIPSQLPKNIGGLKDAMFLHIRILWSLRNAKEVPGNPPEELLAMFASRFSTEQEVLDARNGNALVGPSLVQVGTSIPLNDKSRSAKQIRQVEEHILEYLQGCIAKFGLVRWAPDLRQSAYSLYNSACRIIALDTFKQAIISHAYDFLRPNPVYLRDMDLLMKVYDHIVHFYLLVRYTRECMAPGTVRAKDDANPTYRNRQRLADARLKFVKQNGYPTRYWRLIHPRATSDDEADSNGQKIGNQVVHWIKRRPERSSAMETFVRRLEYERKLEATQDPLRRWRERPRLVPDSDQKDTAFPALPLNMPIDYFHPSVFNKLQPHLRRRAAVPQIALLPDAKLSFTRHPDELLNDKDFNNKYGSTILKEYKVDDHDLGLFGEDDEEDDDWEDNDLELDDTEMECTSEGDEAEDVDMVDKRSKLIAHLSTDSI